MSSKPGWISNEEYDPEERDSVFDFLYQDARRIGSFLAQFDNNGHLTALTRTIGAIEASGVDATAGAGAGVTGLLSLNTSGVRHTNESATDTAAKTYDPLWLNSLAFLDYLTQRGLIHQGDLTRTKVGQFALVTGRLVVVDIAMIKAVLLSKRGAERIAKSILGDEKSSEAKTKKERDYELAMATELVQAMFKSFPSAVTTYFKGADYEVWSSVNIDGLTFTLDDLLLKHGASPAGEWNMLGILDALPDPEESESEGEEEKSNPFFEEGTAAKAVSDLFLKMRPNIGRPKKAYGMTPLLIFRKIAAD